MKHQYKKILLAFLFLLQFSFLKAQWVTIPDTNFVNWLNANGYSSCMNGNLMDTTCNAVVNSTLLWCDNSNIHDLTGVTYFDNLTELLCYGNILSSIPSLPNSLIELDCSSNQLFSIQSFPAGLTTLQCSYNFLSNLPALPGSVTTIDCRYNNLTVLPALPVALTQLQCDENQLSNLPALPSGLASLYCSHNQLTNIPSLPNTLNYLSCGYNALTILPALPSSLQYLFCNGNQLTSLPSLSSVAHLTCSYNQLAVLPGLPINMNSLDCSENLLVSLPLLPASLTTLWCRNNQLNNLPPLPNALDYLDCSYNQISGFLSLPAGLSTFDCRYNQITSLPDLPNVMSICYLDHNPNLLCLPRLKTVTSQLGFTNTGVICIPNYGNITYSYPALSSLPLCDVFNSNNCPAYWNINGKVYGDSNGNCIANTNETGVQFMKINLDSSGVLIQQTYTIAEGLYSFDTDTGTYTYTVDTTDLPVLVTCPASGFQTSVLTAVDSMDYDMDFGMQCKPGFDVGVTSVARDSGLFRPAHFARVKIAAGDISNFYGLHCASGTSGLVQVIFNGAVSYSGASAGSLTPVVSGDTLLYSISDFGTVNFNSDFSFVMQTDTAAAVGSQICFDVSVTPSAGDINPANNSLHHCFTIVNSMDPNTKEVFPKGNIDTSQHWLTYTINFQNTGTAPAQHIYILDTLDNNLDESSFTLLAYNHQPLTQVVGKVIRFNFPNINLPDSSSDEPHSHGYVQYKVKLKPGLTNGTLIHNTAHIVFDFNAPVTTNTTENQIFITTGMEGFKVQGSRFKVVPNPFHERTILKIPSQNIFNDCTLEIYNVFGEKVREIKGLNKSEIVIERKNLEAGIYIFKFFSERELQGTGKLIIQ